MPQKNPLIIRVFRIYFNSAAHLFPSAASKQLMNIFSKPRVRVLRIRELEMLNKAKKSFLKFGTEEIKTYEWGRRKSSDAFSWMGEQCR